METVTVQDVRNAILKVAKSREAHDLLKDLEDEEFVHTNVEQDLPMLSLQMEKVIQQLSEDKHLHLPHELHKVLPDAVVKTIVDTVNSCIQEAEKLGVDIND